MKFKSIQTQIALWAGLCLVITAGAIILFSARSIRHEAMKAAEEFAIGAASENGAKIQSQFEEALFTTRTLAQNFASIKDPSHPQNLTRDQVNAILRTIFLKNPDYVGGGTCWEPNAFDGLDAEFANTPNHDATGRLIPYWYQDGPGQVASEPLVDYDKPDVADWYFLPKQKRHEVITEPYIYPVGGKEVLMTTVAAPILSGGTFYGATTIDLTLDFLQGLVDSIRIFDGKAQVAIISNGGTLVALSGAPELAGKPLQKAMPEAAGYLSRLKQGEKISEWTESTLDVFVPLSIGKTETPWSVHVAVPTAVILAEPTAQMWEKVGISSALILIALVLLWLAANKIARPIRRSAQLAEKIALGDLSERMKLNQADEIGQLAKNLDAMTDSLAKKANLAEQIAKGNLDVEVTLASQNDQLGLALQHMTENLNSILMQIQLSGEQIASGAGQVSSSSQTLSQGATESAASLEEISSSMCELASQTKHNAENADQANSLSNGQMNAAKRGNALMGELVAAMEEIDRAGQDINKIIKVIDEIAFQTNLLALNAAVEAARAGQHGKGFAVVAEEVRNLAARSARAAKETEQLIEGSTRKTKNGTEIADKTAAALKGISTGATKVSGLVSEIARASREQASGIEQINVGLGQIDQVTQQNTANAEESAAASEELSGQAVQMQQMLLRFKLKNKGGYSPAQHFSALDDTAPAPKSPPQHELASIALDDSEFGKY